MEPDGSTIEDLRRRYGLAEEEARALYHLGQARNLMVGLEQANYVPERTQQEQAVKEDNVAGTIIGGLMSLSVVDSRIVQHFEALEKVLALRVLRREYPEGWGGDKPTTIADD